MSTVDARDLGRFAEKLERALAERPERVVAVMRKHAGIIEVKARAITPVDTGLLASKNKGRVEQFEGYASLTMENNQDYAVYQHDYPHRHSQPHARDHFISLPFFAELPALVDEIIRQDIEEFS